MKSTVISEFSSDRLIYDHKICIEPTKKSFPHHTHAACELLYFVNGDASYYIEGRIYKLSPGDMLLLRPTLHHGLLIESDKPYERYDVMFDESLLPREISERISNGREVISCTDAPEVKEIFSRMDSYVKRLDKELAVGAYTACLYELLCNFVIGTENERCSSHEGKNSIIAAALKFIEENIRQPISVADIASSLYITKSYLHQLFIDNLHTTPKKYITEKRLLLARREILCGKNPTGVYLECGFFDYATFYRNYKAAFGVSPSDERRGELPKEILS
ncbi:MAG: AraC family transcriptional regulator [Clostridia bacterium]|nr:AraC family transcriptional regulator [Clostridia bacterium]